MSKANQQLVSGNQLRCVGLFAGIGGFELGFSRAGIGTELLCEIEPAAQHVLLKSFPGVQLETDICRISSLPQVDVVAAGFPCQNLSLVGDNAGIFGEQSGLVDEVFRLLSHSQNSPRWVVLENVPFMLWQKKGHAIKHVTSTLNNLGFRWAYRVVDARAFGLPQRRRRVVIVASRTEDPRSILFADDTGTRDWFDDGEVPCGFSWTEGRAGLGWAVNAVPTLKGGSAIGIPSPPAVWDRLKDLIYTPEIRDAERLQGFDHDWTAVEIEGKPIKVGRRWKLIGNAIPVPLAEWIGGRIVSPGEFDCSYDAGELTRNVWPNAAFSDGDRIRVANVSEFPEARSYIGLRQFLQYPTRPLSARATAGFLERAHRGSLRFADGFLESAARHLDRQRTNENSPQPSSS